MQKSIAAALAQHGIPGNFEGAAAGEEPRIVPLGQLNHEELENLLAAIDVGLNGESAVVAQVAAAPEPVKQPPPPREPTKGELEHEKMRNRFARKYEGEAPVFDEEEERRKRDEL